jgi:hypothetical protein
VLEFGLNLEPGYTVFGQVLGQTRYQVTHSLPLTLIEHEACMKEDIHPYNSVISLIMVTMKFAKHDGYFC